MNGANVQELNEKLQGISRTMDEPTVQPAAVTIMNDGNIIIQGVAYRVPEGANLPMHMSRTILEETDFSGIPLLFDHDVKVGNFIHTWINNKDEFHVVCSVNSNHPEAHRIRQQLIHNQKNIQTEPSVTYVCKKDIITQQFTVPMLESVELITNNKCEK